MFRLSAMLLGVMTIIPWLANGEEACGPNCACDAGSSACTQCLPGFHTVPETGYCQWTYGADSCVSSCDDCWNSNICLTCNVGYTWDRRLLACVSIDTDTCTVPNCIDCEVPELCHACYHGYYLESFNPGKCTACGVEHCRVCKAAGTCEVCDFLYRYDADSGVCEACPPLCLRCSTADTCDECEFFAARNDETGRCGEDCDFMDHCQTCYSTLSRCISCEPGYQLSEDETECVPVLCIDNCESCPVEGACEVCKSGYLYDEVLQQCLHDGVCIDHCYSCSAPVGCDSCDQGYAFNPAEQLCQYEETCADHCTRCALQPGAVSSFVTVCHQCASGYAYDHVGERCFEDEDSNGGESGLDLIITTMERYIELAEDINIQVAVAFGLLTDPVQAGLARFLAVLLHKSQFQFDTFTQKKAELIAYQQQGEVGIANTMGSV